QGLMHSIRRHSLPCLSRNTTSMALRRKKVWMARQGTRTTPSCADRPGKAPTPSSRERKVAATYRVRGAMQKPGGRISSWPGCAMTSPVQDQKLGGNRKRNDQKGTGKNAEDQRKHELHRRFQRQFLCMEKALGAPLVCLGPQHGRQAHAGSFRLSDGPDELLDRSKITALRPA